MSARIPETVHPVIASIAGDADAAELIVALLDHVDVRPLALDALASVRRIEWSDQVRTAAIELSTTPYLRLNRAWVQAHCDTPETLAALLLHELAHVTLAHTRLVPRMTPIQNVAFDAIVNRLVAASLRSRGVDAAPYLRLFERVYSADESPWFLLRPPPGWPDRSDWEASAGAHAPLRELHRRLWETGTDPRRDTLPDVTVRELLQALVESEEEQQDRDDADGRCVHDGAGESAPDGAPIPGDALVERLLGNHGTTLLEERLLDFDQLDRLAGSVLGKAMPRESLLQELGCGRGRVAMEERVALGRAHERMVRTLVAALHRAAESGGTVRRREAGDRTVVSPLPDRDRRAAARTRLARHFGAPAPRLFARPASDVADDRVRVAVYLDVSGSMHDVLPALRAALARVRRTVDVRLWQWSEVVHPAPAEWWTQGAIRTTGGTSITCVLAHAAEQARHTRRLLVITDGDFSAPPVALVDRIDAAGVAVHVALTHGGWSVPRGRWIRSLVRID
jgi:hypothetical protein